MPTSFGLLSSCCVQFSLLISSSASTNDFCAARSASPYHLPTTSLHRITYTLFFLSVSKKTSAKSKRETARDSLTEKRTVQSIQFCTLAVSHSNPELWLHIKLGDCRRHKFKIGLHLTIDFWTNKKRSSAKKHPSIFPVWRKVNFFIDISRYLRNP